VSLMFCRPRMALSTGWTGVVVKARLLVVGLRRRRHDWHTEEAKVRGVRKEAILGGWWWCILGINLAGAVACSILKCRVSRGFAAADRHWASLDSSGRPTHHQPIPSPPTTIPFTHSTERRLPLHLSINPFIILIAVLSLRSTIFAHAPHTTAPA
jgi:hypothetical protein